MNEIKPQQWPSTVSIDEGLIAVCQVAAYYRIAADPGQLRHELALADRVPGGDDLIRAAHLLRLNARILRNPSEHRLKAVPTPAIVVMKDKRFALLGAPDAEGRLRLIDPLTRVIRMLSYAELSQEWAGAVILISRRVGVGIDPKTFGFHWFLPSLWRYRKPLGLRAGRLAVHSAVCAGDAAVLPDRGRQGPGAQRHLDTDRRHHRAGRARAVSGDAAVPACLHPVAFGKPYRRRARRAVVLSPAAAATALFRDPRCRPDRRTRARARDDPFVPDRTGTVLGDRPVLHYALDRSAVCLFVVHGVARAVHGTDLRR